MTLTEFLLARIAEDVEGATPGEGWNVSGWDHDVPVQFWDYGEVHVGHKRFLAECEAKRRIMAFAIEFRRAADEEADPVRKLLGEAMAESAEDALVSIAMVYADHPDFREEWRVL